MKKIKRFRFDKRLLNRRLSKKQIKQIFQPEQSDIMLIKRIINARASALNGDIENTCLIVELAIDELTDLHKDSTGINKFIIGHISEKISFILKKIVMLSILVNTGQTSGIVFDELNKPELKRIIIWRYIDELEKVKMDNSMDMFFPDIINLLQSAPIKKGYTGDNNEIRL